MLAAISPSSRGVFSKERMMRGLPAAATVIRFVNNPASSSSIARRRVRSKAGRADAGNASTSTVSSALAISPQLTGQAVKGMLIAPTSPSNCKSLRNLVSPGAAQGSAATSSICAENRSAARRIEIHFIGLGITACLIGASPAGKRIWGLLRPLSAFLNGHQGRNCSNFRGDAAMAVLLSRYAVFF